MSNDALCKCGLVYCAPGRPTCWKCQQEATRNRADNAVLDREHEESEKAAEERETKRAVPLAPAAVRINGEWRVS